MRIDLRRRNMRHLMIFVCNRWHCVWVVWQNLVLYLRFLVLSDSTHPFRPDCEFPFTSRHRPPFSADILQGVALHTPPWHHLTKTSGWDHPLSQLPHQPVRINLSRHRKPSKNTRNSNAVMPNLKRFVFILFHFFLIARETPNRTDPAHQESNTDSNRSGDRNVRMREEKEYVLLVVLLLF